MPSSSSTVTLNNALDTAASHNVRLKKNIEKNMHNYECNSNIQHLKVSNHQVSITA